MFHSASDMAAQTLYRSPTAALDGRYSRLEATKQCLSFPVQLTSNQQSRSLRKITYHRQSTTTKSSKSTSPPNQPTVIINQSAQSTRPNPTKCLPPTPTNHVLHNARNLRPNPRPKPHALQKPSAGDANTSCYCCSQRRPTPPDRMLSD